MKASLNQLAFEKFKKNIPSYVTIGIMCGLFLVLIAMLSLISDVLTIAIMPLIGMPILFASHIASYYIKADQPISVSAISRYYIGFFRPQFRSSFRGIKSFLLALAFYAGAGVVSFLVFFAIYQHQYGEVFTSSLFNLARDYLSNDFTYENLTNALSENNNLLLTFIICVYSCPLPVGITYFIYSASYSSLSIYYRNNMMTAAPALIRLAINNTYSFNGKKIRRDWFILNWPLLVLSLVGSIAGAVLVFTVFKDLSYLSVCIILGSVALLLFYLPFYFPRMEVLFERYENAFLDGNKRAVNMIIERIQNSIDLTDDEKRSLEESFKNDNKEEE